MIVYIIIYVISAVGVYFGIQKAHSKGGPLDHINPSFADLIFTFVPFVNTFFFALFFYRWAIYKIDKIFHTNDSLSKFFRIKK